MSFVDGLQRVILFSCSNSVKERALASNRDEDPAHSELTLSLIGTGLSLVDDIRGQEVAYIGIPQLVYKYIIN